MQGVEREHAVPLWLLSFIRVQNDKDVPPRRYVPCAFQRTRRGGALLALDDFYVFRRELLAHCVGELLILAESKCAPCRVGNWSCELSLSEGALKMGAVIKGIGEGISVFFPDAYRERVTYDREISDN